MKRFILLPALCLLFNLTYAQVVREALLIGKTEPEVLQEMIADSDYHYKSLNQLKDDNYSITYVSDIKENLCNFFFTGDTCNSVVYYYQPEKLPSLIASLNKYYKRTDDRTWTDNSLRYIIKIFDTQPDLVMVGFKKL